jgi:hypothetical protein
MFSGNPIFPQRAKKITGKKQKREQKSFRKITERALLVIARLFFFCLSFHPFL